MKIALDAMGGDFAPQSTIEGALLAIQDFPAEHQLVLVGREDVLKAELDARSFDSPQIEIMHAEDVIGMEEHPTKAISQKKHSSINIGYHLLKEGAANAFCSAGNTGAMLVGAMFTIRAIEGIIRPGIAGLMPKLTGDFGVVMDVGANAECKPDVLYQFGEIASIYASNVLGIPSPKVGLMNLGEEEKKGTLLTQAAYQLFRISEKINFAGNIEGRDLFNDKADVIVCDGFTGNVILKMAESVYDIFKDKGLDEPFFNRFNYEAIGGSPILGVNGNVIIGHGVSSPIAIKNMVMQGLKMAESNLYVKIKESLSK